MAIVGTALISCSEEEHVIDSPMDVNTKIIDMVQYFHRNLHSNNRAYESAICITSITTDSYKVQEEKKTKSSTTSDSFDIHTVSLNIDGTPGYAILSDTPGIEKVFYYSEDGCIGDTAVNPPLKYMIESFPVIAEDILTGIIADQTSTYANYPNIQPIVRFHWHQAKPFNNCSIYCTCTSCSQDFMGNHRPIGCVTIALGQSIATIKKFTGTFYGNRAIDFDNLPSSGYGGTESQYLQIAHFLHEIALNCQTKFGCNESGTTLAPAYNYLKDLGYNTLLTEGALIE